MRGGTQWAPPLMLFRYGRSGGRLGAGPSARSGGEPWSSLARLELVEPRAQLLEEPCRSCEVFLDAREVRVR